MPPSTCPGTEDPSSSQIGVSDPRGDRSPLDENAPHNERDQIQHILDENETQNVLQGLQKILKRLRNVKQPSNRRCKKE